MTSIPPEWLLPLSSREPCGPSLEYDNEYAILLARMMPRPEAQYGHFIGTPELPNWADIERDCQRLLLRTKDINLVVWLCRARTRLRGAAGLTHTLAMLAALLEAWPAEVHPQLVIEGECDPVVRANALAGLADPEGLLADVCEIVVAPHTATRLTVRDVERAFATPRVTEPACADSVSQQLNALRATSADPHAPLRLLAQAALHLRAIDAWSRNQLGDEAPSLHALSRLLAWFTDPVAKVDLAQPTPETGPVVPRPFMNHHANDMTVPARTRNDVLATLQAAREWFEVHEPSSPVTVLLRQAERMVGKRFSQVADAIPLDLLRKWEPETDRTAGDA